jgi:hypothetical protein
MDNREATFEYLNHLKNRAQGRMLMEQAGIEAGDTGELLDELNDLSDRIHQVYKPLLEAMALQNERLNGKRSAA